MEGILTETFTTGAGVFMSALAILVLAFAGVLLGHLAEEEKTGKRFYWAEWPLPGEEPTASLPEERATLHAA